MKNKILFLMAGIICTFLFGSCEEENNEENLNGFSTAQQVDMTVLVPIHPSSLEYFDYVIHYYDNRGVECRDTIQNPSGGIEVVDWSAANGISNNCYVRTFSYDDLFVTCSVNVEMIPKKGLTTMDPFYFYIPKPYITPSVHDPKTSVIGETASHIMEGVECIHIDAMDIESFQSTYGRTFSSHCGLTDSYVGYEIFFY